jgi:hypothetical protein
MKWRFSPILSQPDFAAWQRGFPRGIGPSIFSSPAWQTLMIRELDHGWSQRILHGQSGDTEITLPVFVRLNWWRRYDLTVRPIAYYVTPIGQEAVDAEVVRATLDAVASMRTATFTWWLPPWCSWRPDMLDCGQYDRCFSHSAVDTYIITLQQPFEEYMARYVSKTQLTHAHASMKHGLEVIDHPSPQLVDEYYSLYQRVYEEQHWIDQPFSRQFFHGVATTLEDGGQLFVMKYEDRVVGGGILLYDNYAVHYFQGTTDRHVKVVHPHTVLYVEALKRACARGLKYVNLGGVNPGNVGLIRFKLAWGAMATPVPILEWRCNIATALKSVFRSESAR